MPPKQHPPCGYAPIRHLWDLAYEKLRQDEPDLMTQYEADLKQNYNIDLNATREHQMHALLMTKMEEVERNTWKLKFSDYEVPVRDLAAPVLGVISMANEHIGNATDGNPYASLAWSGVSLLLQVGGPFLYQLIFSLILIQLLLNPSEQAISLAQGISYIASLISQSRLWEELYRRRYEATSGPQTAFVAHIEYKTALADLYQSILKYQVTAYNYYSQNSAFRLGLDAIKWNDWESLLNEIREKERVFTAITQSWRDMKYDEECQAAQQRHDESMSRWDSINIGIQGLRDAIQAVQADKDRSELLKWLSNIDPSEIHNHAREKQVPGTGNWFLEGYAFRT
jgi:hypothetical protein